MPAPLKPEVTKVKAEEAEEKPPPLPRRRKASVHVDEGHGDGDGMLVVEAPMGSEPGSPEIEREAFLAGEGARIREKVAGYVSPSVEDVDDERTPTNAAM